MMWHGKDWFWVHFVNTAKLWTKSKCYNKSDLAMQQYGNIVANSSAISSQERFENFHKATSNAHRISPWSAGALIIVQMHKTNIIRWRCGG